MPSGVTTATFAFRRWSIDCLKRRDSEAALPNGGAAFFGGGRREGEEGVGSEEILFLSSLSLSGCHFAWRSGAWRGAAGIWRGCGGVRRDRMELPIPGSGLCVGARCPESCPGAGQGDGGGSGLYVGWMCRGRQRCGFSPGGMTDDRFNIGLNKLPISPEKPPATGHEKRLPFMWQPPKCKKEASLAPSF